MADLTEHRISGELVYEGKFLKINKDRVRLPDGSEAVREYVRHPGACVIVPEVRPGVFVVERQFRYPVGKVFVEFPAGKLDPDESLLACAKRELEEETGYSASDWEHLGTMHNCIGYSDERIEIFHARNLVAGEAKLDVGEFVELQEMSFDELRQGVLDGWLTDAKTITCLFWLAARRSGRSA